MLIIYEATTEPPFVEPLLMPTATLSTLHTLWTHLIILITLHVRCYFPYLPDREIETQSG